MAGTLCLRALLTTVGVPCVCRSLRHEDHLASTGYDAHYWGSDLQQQANFDLDDDASLLHHLLLPTSASRNLQNSCVAGSSGLPRSLFSRLWLLSRLPYAVRNVSIAARQLPLEFSVALIL